MKVCAESCRGVLKQMYTARIGPLDRVPLVMVARDQLRWLSIDHRAGFVLSLVDGVSSLEMILDVSGMPELDALRILSDVEYAIHHDHEDDGHPLGGIDPIQACVLT